MQSRPQNNMTLSQTSSKVKDTGIRHSARIFAPYVFLQWQMTASSLTALVARPGNIKQFFFFPTVPNSHGTKYAFQNKINAEPYG